jgi:hypothetical protein
MKVIYRISNAGYKKNKPSYVNPKTIFLHFLSVFVGHDIYVIADNLLDETYEFLCLHFPKDRIFRTRLSNAGAFMYAVEYAIRHFKDTDVVYFAEDDYIYTRGASRIIEEGLSIADYSTGYDHPDKYINHCDGGPNYHISEGGELTRVLITKSSHWKFTNSCCMTFATTVRVLKRDLEVYKKHCSTSHPNDFPMFEELIQLRKSKLVSPIPSVSTHGEYEWLAKFVDWEKEVFR